MYVIKGTFYRIRFSLHVYDVEAFFAECIEKNVSLKGLGSVLFIELHYLIRSDLFFYLSRRRDTCICQLFAACRIWLSMGC